MRAIYCPWTPLTLSTDKTRSIPVGCAPSAAVTIGERAGCASRGCAWGGVLPGRGRVCLGAYPSMHWGRHPPREQNDWQTPVKILPCRNFVADGKDVDPHVLNGLSVNLTGGLICKSYIIDDVGFESRWYMLIIIRRGPGVVGPNELCCQGLWKAMNWHYGTYWVYCISLITCAVNQGYGLYERQRKRERCCIQYKERRVILSQHIWRQPNFSCGSQFTSYFKKEY